MNTRKYKGGQLASNLLNTRSRLRKVSPNEKKYREGFMGRKTSNLKRSNSSLSVGSFTDNAKTGAPFKVGDKWYKVNINPEIPGEELFSWNANTNGWFSPSSPRTSTGLFGGYKPTKKNLKYLKLYKQGKSIGFTMRSSLKAKGLIPRANGTYKVSSKYK